MYLLLLGTNQKFSKSFMLLKIPQTRVKSSCMYKSVSSLNFDQQIDELFG